MKTWYKRWGLIALCAAMLVILCSCGGSNNTTPSPTEAPMEADQAILIQMYGTLDETYVPFLNALADKFPEIDLRYEFQWDLPSVHEVERRILHNDGPDIAVVNGEALNSLTEKEVLLDLTGTELVTRYHVSTMTQLNDQGRVLGLPLPNDLRCLLCNRGMLEQYGLELPKTVPELIEICRILTEQGQGGIIADEQLYQMLLRTTYLCQPVGYDWLQRYNSGTDVMAGTPAADAWEDFAAVAAVSGCTSEDALALPAARTASMLSGKYAFRVITLSNLNFMRESDPTLDMVALPLLGATESDQWVFYANQSNMRYFVASGALEQPDNAAKKEIVLRVLDWISSDEAQQILASCGSAAISYVNGVDLNQKEVTEYLDPIISAGYLTSNELLGRGVQELLPNCAAQVLDGTMTAEDAVAACDTTNKNYTPTHEDNTGKDEVLGTASATIYWRKPAAVTVGAPLAQLAAQAMAEAFPEADFAFAMAKNTTGTLYAGDITLEDVLFCANGEGDRELLLVRATGEQIRALIEAGVGSLVESTYVVPYGVAGKGRLLHPVGLTYRADLTRENNDKVTEIILTDGGDLEADKLYTVIVSGLLVDNVTPPNLEGCEMTVTGKYLRDVMIDYVRAHGEISPPELGFEIAGATPRYTLP